MRSQETVIGVSSTAITAGATELPMQTTCKRTERIQQLVAA